MQMIHLIIVYDKITSLLRSLLTQPKAIPLDTWPSDEVYEMLFGDSGDVQFDHGFVSPVCTSFLLLFVV
jgi:hypothetical protein